MSNTALRVFIGMASGVLVAEVWKRYDKYRTLKEKIERCKKLREQSKVPPKLMYFENETESDRKFHAEMEEERKSREPQAK